MSATVNFPSSCNLASPASKKTQSLDNDKQGKFIFLNGFDFTTTEVADLYTVNQSNISSTRLYRAINKSCLNYSKRFASDSIDEPRMIKALRDWLRQHLKSIYTNLLYEVVDSLVMSQLKDIEISFLRDLWKQRGIAEQLAQKMNQSPEYINEEKQRLKDVITGFVVNYLTTNFEIIIPLTPVVPKIAEFIDKWMSDRPTN